MAHRRFKEHRSLIEVNTLRVLLEKTRSENLIYRLSHSHYDDLDTRSYTGETRISDETGETGEYSYGEGAIVLPADLKLYAVVASSAITGGTAVITGSIAISPNNASSVTEFPPATYTGVEDAANPAALAAQTSLTGLYTTLLNLSSPNPLISELGTTYSVPTLTSTGPQNVYKTIAGLLVDGTLTLIGGSCDQFYFIAGSTIEFSRINPVTIILSGGLQESNIFWVSQSSITVNNSSFLSGILIAEESIIFLGTSTLFGPAFTRNAAVTLADTKLTIQCLPEAINVRRPNEEMEYLSIGSSVNAIETTKYSLRAPQN